MPPRPSHKRAAASSGENTPAPEGSRKKTRFVEPSEDPANFAEEVDAQLENPSARRKGRVNTEGYESDSSDDGEGVVNSRKPGAAGAADEDDDMFAMGEKEEKKDEDKPFELADLKLRIHKGSFVAIVGRVGSGKVSFILLLEHDC